MKFETEQERRARHEEHRRLYETSVRWSRCKSGSRWFWAVYPSPEECDARGIDRFGCDPTAEGFAPTLEEAERLAREAGGDGVQINDRSPAGAAQWTLKKRAAEKRMKRPAKDSGSAPVEYVYRTYFSCSECIDYKDEWHIVRHRIIKKTAKRVYIARKEEWYDVAWREPREGREQTVEEYIWSSESYVLDRHKLEHFGKAEVKSERWYHFYPTREKAEESLRDCRGWSGQSSPGWAVTLGLTPPCSLDDVKTAYREKAKAHHPDAGGDAAEFTKIETAYRHALTAVS